MEMNLFFLNKIIFRYNIEKDIAAYIKKEFDKKYNPTWHCIVGRNFGRWVKKSNINSQKIDKKE